MNIILEYPGFKIFRENPQFNRFFIFDSHLYLTPVVQDALEVVSEMRTDTDLIIPAYIDELLCEIGEDISDLAEIRDEIEKLYFFLYDRFLELSLPHYANWSQWICRQWLNEDTFLISPETREEYNRRQIMQY